MLGLMSPLSWVCGVVSPNSWTAAQCVWDVCLAVMLTLVAPPQADGAPVTQALISGHCCPAGCP